MIFQDQFYFDTTSAGQCDTDKGGGLSLELEDLAGLTS